MACQQFGALSRILATPGLRRRVVSVLAGLLELGALGQGEVGTESEY
jgi:hypothetical protein